MKRLSSLLSVREAGQLASKGGQDSITLHINPREARTVIPILKGMGGSGRPNPITGGLNFDETDSSAADAMSEGFGGGYGGAGYDYGGGGGDSWDSGYVSDSDAASQWSGGWAGGNDDDWQDYLDWSAQEDAARAEANAAAAQAGLYSGPVNADTGAFETAPSQPASPFNEEDATQGWSLAPAGTAARDAQNTTAKGEANALGWSGNWDGVFGNTDLNGESFTNWGGLANNVVNSPLTQIAAGLIGGPVAAGVVGAGRALNQGNYGNLASILASFANPLAGQAIGLANSVYQNGPAGLLGAAANYGLNTQGLNFGQGLNSFFGNDRGTFGSAVTQAAGNSLQGSVIGNLIGSLDLGGWAGLSDGQPGEWGGPSDSGDSGSYTADAMPSLGGESGRTPGLAYGVANGGEAQPSGYSPLAALLGGQPQGQALMAQYSPVRSYAAGFMPAATSAPEDYNAAMPQSPMDLQKLLGAQPAKSIYSEPRRLASVLNQGDYYAA